jgi:hypothetical protein
MHHALLPQPDLAHLSRLCLAHLMTIQGPIFTEGLTREQSDDLKRAFVGHFVGHFVEMITSYLSSMQPLDDDPELIGITDILRRLFSNYKLGLLHSLPSFLPLMKGMSDLTTACIRFFGSSSTDQEDTTSIVTAMDELLDTWARMGRLNSSVSDPSARLSSACGRS